MSEVSRRDFLKGVTLAGTAALMGCSSQPSRELHLIPHIHPPQDIIPGGATWYATTCRECPAGCGLLAKNRDGHVIKMEGNPLHPVNQGKLCPRGQASVQGIYDPDRYREPLQKKPDGSFASLSWPRAEELLLDRLRQLKGQGKGARIFFLTDLVTGGEKDLVRRWLGAMGSEQHIIYEPYAYEALRKANQLVYGKEGIPTYHIDEADFLLSFGANFMEAWLSNVQYARQFASFHALREGTRNPFVYIGPRLSMTAANADLWIAVPPHAQSLLARGMLWVAAEEGLIPSLREEEKALLKAQGVSPNLVEHEAGFREESLRKLTREFSRAQRPLALVDGLFCSDLRATETAIAANLLCSLAPDAGRTTDFEDPSSIGDIAPAEKMKDLADRMQKGAVDLLLIYRANPLYSLPPAWEFQKALKRVPFVVSFSTFPDETSHHAHLILPTHTFLESWGEYSPRRNVRGLMQPVMGPMFNTRPLGDILISTGKKVDEKKFPWKNFYTLLRESWGQGGKGAWQESVQRGGWWTPGAKKRSLKPLNFSLPQRAVLPEVTKQGFDFITYPTIQFFDGRSANRPFLQELPDPVTQITWAGWVEINPLMAERQGIRKGDVLTLRSAEGTLQAPAFPYPGIPEGTLAMPIGQGHASYGRFASSQSGNPLQIILPRLDPGCGGIIRALSGVTIEKAGLSVALANTDGSRYQHGRNFVRAISWQQYQGSKSKGEKLGTTLPLPEGFAKRDDFYKPHEHVDYRWAMIVDLDRCIGCGACVVACYAENNVPVVGREQVLGGREMSWLRIERYFEPEERESKAAPMVRFLPMLCQHCDEAPCESVCPVFAPHHSKEGINNQVYNRCIGTRFCSQNCPYKVRRFNWFTWPHPEPLNWQLNPDVTVRHKGVMEKCSFCIQRIVAAKIKATSEGRKVRDGEFTTACAQTCPADVLTFGNLLDPDSRVSKLIQDPRAYQVLRHLNTKPAVIYLKKLIQVVRI
jgi:anaerobic selenocysteine-containing dehydrogenase/Fe-S-cluster-containing dehydrogenase component